jgi:hypothetical protein
VGVTAGTPDIESLPEVIAIRATRAVVMKMNMMQPVTASRATLMRRENVESLFFMAG